MDLHLTSSLRLTLGKVLLSSHPFCRCGNWDSKNGRDLASRPLRSMSVSDTSWLKHRLQRRGNQYRKSTKSFDFVLREQNLVLRENWQKWKKPLARLRKKREKIQIINIRNERQDITIVPTNMKREIKEYCEWFYTHKFDNLDETDQFLERHNLPKIIKKKYAIWIGLYLLNILNQ